MELRTLRDCESDRGTHLICTERLLLCSRVARERIGHTVDGVRLMRATDNVGKALANADIETTGRALVRP